MTSNSNGEAQGGELVGDDARCQRAADLARQNEWKQDVAGDGYIDANGMVRNVYGELVRAVILGG